MLHANVAKGRIKDIDELRSRILTAWDELDQRGHFEHKPSQ